MSHVAGDAEATKAAAGLTPYLKAWNDFMRKMASSKKDET